MARPSQKSTRPGYDIIPGYEGTATHREGVLHRPPRQSNLLPHPETQPSHPNWTLPPLSRDEARQAFIKYAEGKCCFSSRPAKEGVITSMEAFDTYRYRLETFTETRSSKWNQRPYHGEKCDTSGQAPPAPWDIAVNVPAVFHDGKQTIEVPRTSSVKDCIRCDKGRLHCHHCAGSGGKKCFNCGQVGALASYEGTYFCAKCYRVGSPICRKCSGLGWTECDVCLGQGKVVVSISLTVQWTNNKEELTIEQSSGLKRAKLDKVPWKVLFTESGNMVHPITSFPDPTVVCTSERLVRKHQAKYAKTSHILQQRQTIELLPITKVSYTNGGESHVFFVYGRDFKVDAVDYPAACCSCCSVM